MDPVEQRLRFLKQAAHALAVPSPTVSATLGATHSMLLAADEGNTETLGKEWNALRRDVCGACGNVMVPGWTCKVSHQSRSGKKRKDRPKLPKDAEKHIAYSCLRCDRKTIQLLQPRLPKHTRPSADVSHVAASEAFNTNRSIDEDSKVVKSANATSKQRKKARKGGLQAMLEKSKTDSTQKLDLMDFML